MVKHVIILVKRLLLAGAVLLSLTPLQLQILNIGKKPTQAATVYQDGNLKKLQLKIAALEGKVKGLEIVINRLKKRGELKVTATAYSPTVEECDADPWNTALMTRPTEGRTLAVSQDLRHLLGKYVYIPGYGKYLVEDLMNKRFKKRIDFFYENTYRAKKFGKKKLKMVVLDNIGG